MYQTIFGARNILQSRKSALNLDNSHVQGRVAACTWHPSFHQSLWVQSVAGEKQFSSLNWALGAGFDSLNKSTSCYLRYPRVPKTSAGRCDRIGSWSVPRDKCASHGGSPKSSHKSPRTPQMGPNHLFGNLNPALGSCTPSGHQHINSAQSPAFVCFNLELKVPFYRQSCISRSGDF